MSTSLSATGQPPYDSHEVAPTNGGPAANGAPSEDLRRLAAIVNTLLRHRVLIVGLPLIAVAIVVIVTLSRPRQYTSSARFAPQGVASSTPLAGIAAQFGFGGATGDRAQSPAFYTELLTSHTILERVANGSYSLPTERGTITGTLTHVLKQSGMRGSDAEKEGVNYLRRVVGTNVSPSTGVISLDVRSQWPTLAYQLNRAVLSELDRFNRETRQSQAAAERRFVEERLRVARSELTEAENQLQAFLQQNRAWQNSPQLRFQQDRLLREVNLRNQMYASLAQSLEKARIDEVRDTPVLTIIEEPRLSTKPEPRGLVRRGLLAAILAGLMAVFIAIAADFLRLRGAATAEEFIEFETLRAEALRDLRNPLRPIGRIFRIRPRGRPTELRR